MSDLARRLRGTRESRGVSLEEAAHATKIKRGLLEAIDMGDYARLPDGPPARGFIRIYARYLGLDADQALADFESEVGVPITQLNEVVPPPPERQQAVSRYTQTVKLPQVRWKGELPPASDTDLDLLAEPDSGRQARGGRGEQSIALRSEDALETADRLDRSTLKSSFSLKVPKAPRDSEVDLAATPRRPSYRLVPSTAMVRAGLVGLAAVGGLIAVVAVVALVIVPLVRSLTQGSRASTPPARALVTVIAPQAQPATTVIVEMAATPSVPDNPPQPAEPSNSGNAATPAVAIPILEGGGVEIVLDALERAWVRVTVDGSVVYEGIPALGPNIRWRGKATVGMETGNAGAFDVIINGARLGPAGQRNAVAKLTWNAEGQVVSSQ
jgi:cytoskeleton protein RodZ